MPVVYQGSQNCLVLNLYLKGHGSVILLCVTYFTRLLMKLEAELGELQVFRHICLGIFHKIIG